MPKKIIATVFNDVIYDQRMIRICTSLAEAGYEVELVGRLIFGDQQTIQKKYKQKRLSCWFSRGKFLYIEYNIRLFFYLLFRQADLICSVDLDTILPGFWVSRWKKIPQVYDAHEYFSEVPEVVRRPKIQWFWEQVADYTIPKIPYCYTVGTSLAKVFTERYQTPFGVIRNVNYAQRKESSSFFNFYSDKIFFYQGALNEGRGLEAMIDLMEYLDGVEFWLAGEGDLSQELRALVRQKGLTDKVKFLGYVLPKDLPALTEKAFLGVNLLENKGLSYYYSLANKTFDYIQAGIPALHMNFPEYQAINTQYEIGVLVDDLERTTLLNATQRLLNDPIYYKQLQENCHRAAGELTWEKEGEQLIKFYQQIDF